jgi:hypothetical protein
MITSDELIENFLGLGGQCILQYARLTAQLCGFLSEVGYMVFVVQWEHDNSADAVAEEGIIVVLLGY